MTNHIQLINVDPVRSEQTEILVGNSVIIAKSLNLYIIIFNTYCVLFRKRRHLETATWMIVQLKYF